LVVVVPPGFFEFIMWISERAAAEEQAGNISSNQARPGPGNWEHPNPVQTQLRNYSWESIQDKPKSKRKPNAHNRAYSREFKKCKSRHQKKNGGWKKGGFKRCVKEAHRRAKAARKR